LPHERYLWDTGFHWGEWLEPGGEPRDFGAFVRADKSEVATAYLYRSAATVVRVAEVLGLPEDQRRPHQVIAAGALAAWQREFIRDDGTLAVATQASHVRALAFGLVPAELRAAVAGRLAELIEAADGHLTTGFLNAVGELVCQTAIRRPHACSEAIDGVVGTLGDCFQIVIIERLRQAGYTFVTVSQLMNDGYYERPL